MFSMKKTQLFVMSSIIICFSNYRRKKYKFYLKKRKIRKMAVYGIAIQENKILLLTN